MREAGVSEQNGAPVPVPRDPVQVLRDTRRTLLKLVENIDAALDAAKASARNRYTES